MPYLLQYSRLMSEILDLYKADEAMRKMRVHELKARFRSKLLERHRRDDQLFDVLIEPPACLFLELSAIYEVCYKAKLTGRRDDAAGFGIATSVATSHIDQASSKQGDGLSFVWGVFGDLMLRLKANSRSQRDLTHQGTGPKPYLPAALRELLSR